MPEYTGGCCDAFAAFSAIALRTRPRPIRYLRQTRSRWLVACFLLASLLLVRFSDIDLRVSALFYDRGFPMAGHWWAQALHRSTTNLLFLSMGAVLTVYAFNRIMARRVGGIDGRRVMFLLGVLVLGAGLVVNAIGKDNFGRARPRDIVQFGGAQQFTPAFVMARGCDRNCSFPSGEAAGAFFAMALAAALSRRRLMLVVAVGFGLLVSFSRIAMGAHFFSDCVVSFFVMLLLTDVLYFYMLAPRPTVPEPRPVAGPVPLPVPVPAPVPVPVPVKVRAPARETASASEGVESSTARD
jgi:lipid A 4'-phosphatase